MVILLLLLRISVTLLVVLVCCSLEYPIYKETHLLMSQVTFSRRKLSVCAILTMLNKILTVLFT